MKIFTGTVLNTNTAKTAVVSVQRIVVHPLYKKRFKRDRKYQVHDELGVASGQIVKFTASKPYSKTKKWKILEVVGVKKAELKVKIATPKIKPIKKSATSAKTTASQGKKGGTSGKK